ncbi:MAG: MATE family efflux transporter [Rikenellaceae bacterium]
MFRFSKYREQYRANLRLALPVVLSQLGNVVVQIADNAMVGRYGGDDPTPLAATAFGGSVFFIVMISVMGLTFGLTPLVGALFAQGRKSVVSKYLQNGLVLYNAVAVVAVLFLLAIIPLFQFMGQPQEVVAMSIPYYKALVWSMIPVIIFFSFKQFFEGVGNTRLAMIAVVVSNVINIVLNYMLIGGNMGAPEMGALGAGVATAISRVVSAVVLVYYFLRSRDYAIYRRGFSLRNFSMAATRRLVKMGVPISMQMALEVASFVIIGLMFGWFSATEIGANQIGIAMSNCSFMIIVAVASATTIRISHCYGLRDYAQLKLAGYAAWHLALAWNLITAAIFFVFRSQLPLIFTSNVETAELASVLLLAIAAFQIPDGIQSIAVGVLRGMQDVKIIPYIAFVSYWVFNMPIAYLCAFVFGMGAPGLYVGYFVGFAIASVLLIWRIRHRQRILEQGGR